MSEDNPNYSYLILGVLTVIWGTSFILIKKGLVVYSPAEVASLRVAAASLFLLPVAVTKLKGLKPSHLWKLFLSGMLGIFIPSFLFSVAQTRIDSSVAGIVNCLTPLWTMILGALFFGQRFRKISFLGIAVGLAGTIILILSRSDTSLSGINLFALLIVIATALYGINLNFIKFKIQDIRSLTITSVSVLLIGPFALIYLFGFTDFTTKLTSVEGGWKAMGFVVLLAFMSTAIATVMFNKLIKISSPVFASSVTYLMPIVAVMWGLLDGETLYIGHILGMVAIVGGVYLANK
ncbi:MAG: EamA family transporter [Flammeovirgaceae bacterium]|nr:EamA family transporter [Flammeovirgaceae bacterium]